MARSKNSKPLPATDDEDLSGSPEAFNLDGIYSGSELSPALASAMAELGIEDQGTVAIYVSQLLADGREARIWQGPPADYDLAGLAKRFGSGDYRVKLYAPMASGKMVKRGQRDFPMRLEPGDDALLESKRNPLASALAPGAALTAESIAKAVTEGIRAAMPAPVPQIDPVKMVEGMLGMLGGMMKQLAPPAAPVPAPVNPMNSFAEMMQMVRAFIDTSRSVAPAMPLNEEGKIDIGGAALARGANLFFSALEKQMTGKTPAAAQPAPAPGAEPVNGAETLSPEDEEMMTLWRLQLKQANGAAARNVKPEDFAETVYSMVPDEIIEGMATDAKWFDYLCAYVPECAQYKSWYEMVRGKLVALAIEDGLLTVEDKAPIVPDYGVDPKPGTV